MTKKFQKSDETPADSPEEMVAVSRAEAEALGLIKTTTTVKAVGHKQAKALKGEVKPKKPLSEARQKAIKAMTEARQAKREAEKKAFEEELKKREAENKAKLAKAEKDPSMMGGIVRVPIKKKPERVPRPVKRTTLPEVESDDDSDDLLAVESESEISSEEEEAPPTPPPKKAKAHPPAKAKKQFTEPDPYTELSDFSEVEAIKTKRVLVPRPVKEKVKAIKAIDESLRRAKGDPNGWGDLLKSQWR